MQKKCDYLYNYFYLQDFISDDLKSTWIITFKFKYLRHVIILKQKAVFFNHFKNITISSRSCCFYEFEILWRGRQIAPIFAWSTHIFLQNINFIWYRHTNLFTVNLNTCKCFRSAFPNLWYASFWYVKNNNDGHKK